MIATEKIVSLPVFNPESNGKSNTFTFVGKVDRVEDSTIIDYKGCSDPADFIHSQKIGCQPYYYAMAVKEAYDIDITEIEFRLVQFPSIRFCGKDNGDVNAYESRCIEWLRGDGKVVEFSFVLNPARLDYARQKLWSASKRILEARRVGHWMTNENACKHWNRTCEYADLCTAEADGADVDWIIEQQFEVGENLHPELELNDIDGKEIISHTRISMLTLCEMKHYWRFERGLHRLWDYAESRWLGSAMHVGLEALAKLAKGDGFLGREHAARLAIDDWQKKNPVLGDANTYVDQQCAKARAMARAAAEKWPL